MTETERLAAIEAVRLVKARYWRGVDTSDGPLVQSILSRDCVLDYRGCCTDPASGRDFLPAMNVVLQGRDNWYADAFRQARIISVHQGHQSEITVTSPTTAEGIWAFSDRFFYPEGAEYRTFTGFGFYHDTYAVEDGAWKLLTTRIERLRAHAE